jgi:hypothetical protein
MGGVGDGVVSKMKHNGCTASQSIHTECQAFSLVVQIGSPPPSLPASESYPPPPFGSMGGGGGHTRWWERVAV